VFRLEAGTVQLYSVLCTAGAVKESVLVLAAGEELRQCGRRERGGDVGRSLDWAGSVQMVVSEECRLDVWKTARAGAGDASESESVSAGLGRGDVEQKKKRPK